MYLAYSFNFNSNLNILYIFPIDSSLMASNCTNTENIVLFWKMLLEIAPALLIIQSKETS